MNAESTRQLRDLQTVLEVTRQLALTIDLEALMSAIERAARQVLRCERAAVFLYDHQTNELYSRIATGVGEIRFPAYKGIAGYVVQTGQIVNVPDAYADRRFNPEIDRQTGYRTCNILAVPMYDFSSRLMGVLQALNKQGGCFDDYDEWLAGVLSAQAGVALQRHNLLEEYAAKQKMQRDLDIARTIQQRLLPKEAPQVSGFQIAGWNRPADETGGDCFDFFAREDGSVAISLADATGHGIGPALVVTECRAFLRAGLHGPADLASVMTRVNRMLCQDLPGDRFITAFVALLEPDADKVPYVAAGQGPVLIVRADGSVEQLGSTAIPLGIDRDFAIAAGEPIGLGRGDVLAVMTDGFFEWQDGHGEEFGIDRLAESISRHRRLQAEQIIQNVYKEVLAFVGSRAQPDDLTAVVVKRT